MKDRIKTIRQSANLTQAQFAEKIGLSRNFVAMIEIGQREPSERTLNDICRIFGVDPVWLRTGEGEPFVPQSREDRITEVLSKAIGGQSTARDRLCRALARLPDDAFPLIEEYILTAAESIMNEKKE